MSRFSNNGMEENRGLARDPIPRLRNTPSKMQRETTCSPYRRKKGCDEKHMKQDDNEKSEVEEQCFEVQNEEEQVSPGTGNEMRVKTDQMTSNRSEEYEKKKLKFKITEKRKDGSSESKTITMDKCIKKNQSISYNTTYVFYTVFIMFLCVCLSYCMFMLIQPLTHVNSSGTFESYFKEIKSEYSEQYDLSWKIVKSSVKSVLNHASPESPAVLLLLGMKENEDRINIITDKLARVIAISFNETLPEYKDFDLNNLASISDYVEVKHKIVETISTSVEWNKHHVLVIHHLEKIPAKGAMAFHSFCDHESAPYKNVVYLFRASISEMPLKEDIQLFDSIATKYLNQIWEKDLDQDKRGALISRLTSAVAMFK